MVVCSVCGKVVPTSDMQVEEALELLLAEGEDDDEEYAEIFGAVLHSLLGEDGNA